MAKCQVNAYLIPSEDAHQSEYIASCDGRRARVSGFTGSAGFAVVTQNAAALWTDGRYFLQASKQLSSEWILQKSGQPNVPLYEEWLIQTLAPNSKVGIDARLVTIDSAKKLKEALEKHSHTLVSLPENLVDLAWTDRPAVPQHPVSILELKYTGTPLGQKIEKIQTTLKQEGAYAFIVNLLDEVAWLFNLRGSDIPYNPVFFSYALVTLDRVCLYVDDAKLSGDVKEYLKNVTIRPYESIFADLALLKHEMAGKKLWLDARCSLALKDACGLKEESIMIKRSPIQSLKAIKTLQELEGFRQCHRRDAVALCQYFAWLENELVINKNTSISEADGADKLESFRQKLDKFVGLSFDTISSTGPNGAIIHYKPEHGNCEMIKVDQMYLCDSGAQFLDGTTDTTRTMHFGTPTREEVDAFTRVLKGHIQMDLMTFPSGTTGYVIDCVARLALWRAGLDFRHGTGHGVGSYLNVHEGPHGIGFRIALNEVGLEENMTVTDEPGYYKDGCFGIRIENVLLVKKQDTPNRFGDCDYLGFEHVTVVPIQTKLIDVSLLLDEEKVWINAYHVKCRELVGPLMDPSDPGFKWLIRETKPLE